MVATLVARLVDWKDEMWVLRQVALMVAKSVQTWVAYSVALRAARWVVTTAEMKVCS